MTNPDSNSLPLFLPNSSLENSPDPDNPNWGPALGIGVWVISVLAILLMASLGKIIWDLENYVRVGKFIQSNINDAMSDHRLILYTIFSVILAHLLTLLSCKIVVSKTSKNKFFESIGWKWTANFHWYHAISIVVLFFILAPIFSNLIPSRETDFTKLLKSSFLIKLVIVMVAVGTAPITEEIVYRGMLYGGLRKYFARITTIIIVSILFLIVHVPQYWGGWDALVLLGLLSITLTVVRAYTSSVLPSFFIHLVFNGIQGIIILINGN